MTRQLVNGPFDGMLLNTKLTRWWSLVLVDVHGIEQLYERESPTSDRWIHKGGFKPGELPDGVTLEQKGYDQP